MHGHWQMLRSNCICKEEGKKVISDFHKMEKSYKHYKLSARVSDISSNSQNHFFLRKNITTIWHINIPISAGKRRPISWSASMLHASLSFFIQLCWLSLFSSRQNSSGNCREDRARTGSISNHVTCSPHEDTSQTVEDNFLNFLKESLWLIEQEKCKMWI